MQKIILTILTGCFFIAGCDMETKQRNADGDVPMTDAIYTAENAPSQTEKAIAVKPSPLTSVSAKKIKSDSSQPDKSQTARESLISASQSGQVLKLSDMKPVDNTSPTVQTIDTISQDMEEDEQDDAINKPDARKLAPYPSPVAAGVDDYQDDWIEDAPDDTTMPEPIDGATINPQDQANPLSAPCEDDKRPWKTEKVDPRLDREARKLAREDINAIRSAPKVRKNVVMGQTELVAGNSIQVNSEYITPDQILAGLHKQLSKLAKSNPKRTFQKAAQDTIRNEVMYQIQQHLVYQQANRFLEDQAKKMIDAEIVRTMEEMRNIAGGSLAKLKQQCIDDGTTLDEVLQTQRRELTAQTYLQSKFLPAIVITRQMLWSYYRKNQKKYSSSKEVEMQIIAAPFVAFLPDSTQDTPTDQEMDIAKREAKSYIDKIYRQLLMGGNFTRLAMEKSRGPRARTGGCWPMMAKGNFRLRKVEQAAFGLPQGRFSGVIEDENGYYIVKARKVSSGKKISFEKAQEGVLDPSNPKESIPPIEDILRREQFMKLRQQYLMDIYKKATIYVPENFYKYTTQLAMERYYK